MPLNPKFAMLAAGVVAAFSAASLAQGPRSAPVPSSESSNTLVVAGTLDWLERSDVSALREGVIKQIEFQVGMRVQSGQEIGSLHDEMARLTVEKQKIVAESNGTIAKAKAQKQLATATLARLQRLDKIRKGYVSEDEMAKAEAEVNVADAMIQEAMEKQAADKADYDLALRTLEEHRVLAPFTGIITERMKNPGEAVRANEAVVRLGKTDKFRFVGWVPLESAQRIREGDLIQFHPTVEGSDLPIERKVFTGKISSVSREVSTVRNTEARVLAEIDNPPDTEHPELELFQGMKGEVTIYLNGSTPRVADNQSPRGAPLTSLKPR